MVNLDYLYNPAAAKPIFDRDYFIDKKLGFQVIEHGTILPHKDVYVNGKWTWGKGGIVDSYGNFVQHTHVASYINNIYTPPQNQLYIALKQLFTWDYGFMFGGMLLPITFVVYGF